MNIKEIAEILNKLIAEGKGDYTMVVEGMPSGLTVTMFDSVYDEGEEVIFFDV